MEHGKCASREHLQNGLYRRGLLTKLKFSLAFEFLQQKGMYFLNHIWMGNKHYSLLTAGHVT